jgi:serine/threonine protein kinase
MMNILIAQEMNHKILRSPLRIPTVPKVFFSKQKKKDRLRIIGTPDYIAPEIINGESTDNLGIDWWAVGCILYEFICGIAPFNDSSAELIFKNANSGNIEWPPIGYEEDGVEGMTPEAQDLI